MIHNLVTQDKCKEFVSRLQTNDQWLDGKLTTGKLIAEVKTNSELYGNETADEIYGYCMEKLLDNRDLSQSILLKRIVSVMINRYEVGEGYGWHFDTPLMPATNGVLARTDYSFTLFFNDDYEGGELQIEDRFVKGKAGEIYIYDSNLRHCVHPVTKGTRYACFGWLESAIADKQVREQVIANIRALDSEKAKSPDDLSEAHIALEKSNQLLTRKFY